MIEMFYNPNNRTFDLFRPVRKLWYLAGWWAYNRGYTDFFVEENEAFPKDWVFHVRVRYPK